MITPKFEEFLTTYARFNTTDEKYTPKQGAQISFAFKSETRTYELSWYDDTQCVASLMVTPTIVDGFTTFDLFNMLDQRVATIVFNDQCDFSIEDTLYTVAKYYNLRELIRTWDTVLYNEKMTPPTSQLTYYGIDYTWAVLDKTESVRYIQENNLQFYAPSKEIPHHIIFLNLGTATYPSPNTAKIALLAQSQIAIHSIMGADVVVCRPALKRLVLLFQEYVHMTNLARGEMASLKRFNIVHSIETIQTEARVLIQNTLYLPGQDDIPETMLGSMNTYLTNILNDE